MDRREGFGPLTATIVGVLLLAFLATVVAMVVLGCDPLGCR